MISTLLIEPEAHSVEKLRSHLGTYCPHIEVCGVANSRQEAVQLLRATDPELVFLSMEVASSAESGILGHSAEKFETIILHSNNSYSLEPASFQVGAHLFKPINAEAFIKAVYQILPRLQWKKAQEESRRLLNRLVQQFPPNNLIGVPTMEGIEFLKIVDISRCEGLQRFTKVVATEGRSIISSYNIGKFNKLLRPYGFFSPHKSHLINLQHLCRYSHEGTIVMQDGSSVPVSRRRKALFLNQVRRL